MDEETANLIQLLQSSRRPQMREMAVRQLADRGDVDAAPVLLDLLEDTNDLRLVPIVTAALGGLQRMGPAIAPLLLPMVHAAPEPKRAFLPLLLVSALGSEAVPYLLDALGDTQPEVRVNAATQLGQLRDPRAYDPLLAIVHDDSGDPSFRGVAAAALGALRDPRALPVLIALSRSDDPHLLAGAIDGLADLRHPAGIAPLEALLERPELDERTTRAVRLALLAMERYRGQ